MISKTHKMAILGDVYLSLRSSTIDDENWNNFFNNNDMGFPFSFLYSMGFCEHSNDPKQRQIVEEAVAETWLDFCTMLGLDPTADWQTAEHMFATTENYIIPVFDEATQKELERL